ncbi:MAG: helix-turn-helix domain-containing protein [Draconibacterium sp.]
MQLLQKRLVIKILKSKLFVWSTVPALVLGALIIACFISIKDFSVFPNNQFFEYLSYTDGAAGGNSKVLRNTVSDSIIKLEFQISNQISNPYVGLNIVPKEIKTINPEHFNQLTVRLKGNEINGISIVLITENTLKTSDKKNQEIFFYHNFKILPGINTYTIGLDKFKIPDWWKEYNRIEDVSAIKPDLKKLKAINISSAYTPNINKTLSFEIYSMVFSRNNKPLFILITVLFFGFVLLVFVVAYVIERLKTNRKVITIDYKPVEHKNTENPKSDFIQFINNNFQNSELTLVLVSAETGVNQRKITSEIQSWFGCNFKTYINRLRINESKRLLANKDLNIGEIAFKVGFNNQSHFNRVFKAEFQISPTEYRDKIRE